MRNIISEKNYMEKEEVPEEEINDTRGTQERRGI